MCSGSIKQPIQTDKDGRTDRQTKDKTNRQRQTDRQKDKLKKMEGQSEIQKTKLKDKIDRKCYRERKEIFSQTMQFPRIGHAI